jgi:hypothetical protein
MWRTPHAGQYVISILATETSSGALAAVTRHVSQQTELCLSRPTARLGVVEPFEQHGAEVVEER